jgi:hypothetical protein
MQARRSGGLLLSRVLVFGLAQMEPYAQRIPRAA